MTFIHRVSDNPIVNQAFVRSTEINAAIEVSRSASSSGFVRSASGLISREAEIPKLPDPIRNRLLYLTANEREAGQLANIARRRLSAAISRDDPRRGARASERRKSAGEYERTNSELMNEREAQGGRGTAAGAVCFSGIPSTTQLESQNSRSSSQDDGTSDHPPHGMIPPPLRRRSALTPPPAYRKPDRTTTIRHDDAHFHGARFPDPVDSRLPEDRDRD